MSDFLFAVNTTAPILLMMLCGLLFRRINWLTDDFVSNANMLVYKVCLPCILFFSVAGESLNDTFDGPLIAYAAASIVVVTIALQLLAIPLFSADRRGVVVQGAFRGNMAIIGIAYVLNSYGSAALGTTSVYVAVMTLLYNILAVWVLAAGKRGWLKGMLTNPLIIAVVAGLLWSALSLPVPRIASITGGYFAQITLPLALLCTGATLNLKSLSSNRHAVTLAVIGKLIVVPVVITVGAIALDFRNEQLGLLFLMMATPSAAAGYVMAAQMTPHGAMAAEIIALTTFFSVISVTTGLILLRVFGVI